MRQILASITVVVLFGVLLSGCSPNTEEHRVTIYEESSDKETTQQIQIQQPQRKRTETTETRTETQIETDEGEIVTDEGVIVIE